MTNKRLKDSIMEKASRNKPLTDLQKSFNKLISSVRYKIERTIGTLKRGYCFSRTGYIGLKKGNMEFKLNSMVFNLKKATAMIECGTRTAKTPPKEAEYVV